MKLLRLHLQSYGPFTGHELDFSRGNPGLQVVYGRNEAGKSTTLRALKALLYGIPARTRDDFVHSMPTLRVGGTFETADGCLIELYRRKGNKATLLDADGNPVEGEPLRPLLGGLDEASFERLFGIDHHTLVEGGEALLREHGREAEALFGAGLGSTGLHGVLQQLEQEAAELFAPRASRPRINAGLREFDEIVRAQREAGLSAREWEEAEKNAATAAAELARLADTLAEANRRRSRLERIRRTLPNLTRRRLLTEQLAELGPVPVLGETFRPRYEAAVQQLRTGCEQREAGTRQLEALRERSAGLAVAEDLLTHAETLDELREQLGSYRKARKDQPALIAQRHTLTEQIGKLLAGIRPQLAAGSSSATRDALAHCSDHTILDDLRPALRHKRRASELAARQATLDDGLVKAQAVVDTATHQLERLRTQLADIPAPPPLDGLRQAVDAVRTAGELDTAIETARRRRARQLDSLHTDLDKLGRWSSDLPALRRASLPVDETLQRFRDAYARMDKHAERAADRLAEARHEAAQAEQALDALRRGGSVPTEDVLEQTRGRRDHGWQLLRRQWLLAEDVAEEVRSYAGTQALPDAFEQDQLRSDEIADRLRREAQRVHEQAETRARLDAAGRKSDDARQTLATLEAERAGLDAEWQALWQALDIAPLSVVEMTGWLTRARRLCEKAGEDDQQTEDIAHLEQRRDTLVATLRVATATLGESGDDVNAASGPAPGQAMPLLAGPLKHAETLLATLERREHERARLLERIEELDATRCRQQAELATAQRAVAEWTQQWQVLTLALGLAAVTPPAEVGEYLATLEEACRLADTAASLDERIRTIDRDDAAFEARVAALAGQLAPELAAQPVVEIVAQFAARLETQKEAKSRLDELERQIHDTDETLQQARLDTEQAERQLHALCAEADCTTHDALPAAIERVERCRALERSLAETTEALLTTGDGLTLPALEAEAAEEGADADALRAQLEAVQAHIDDELRPEQERALAQKIEAEHKLAGMGGDDRAAALAESAQAVLATIRRDAEHYLRLRLARRILHDEIERFRRQHRNPMLARAGGHLAMLTCGAFRGVETDFDDNDQPVLIGRRANDEALRVEAMSTGTRDQLYLALRLAAIEQYLDNAAPIPFVVDDILIHFDDERAAATLACLARLAERTQVVLFTHHRRDYEMARKLAGENPQVCALELG